MATKTIAQIQADNNLGDLQDGDLIIIERNIGDTGVATYSTADLVRHDELTANGILVRTADATYTSRSIDGSSNITITNADGVSANPVVTLNSDVSINSLTVAAGAVGTPSVTFSGDLNTGMWSPAADTLAWSTGGSERMRVTSAGFVGIGTSSPTGVLEVSAANPFAFPFRITNTSGPLTFETRVGTGGVEISTSGASTMSFFTNSVRRAVINSSGVFFVGNGETAAVVNTGTISATGGSGTDIIGANLVIRGGQSTGSAAGGALILSTSAAGSSGSSTNTATERMRISSAGNVGVFTSSPSADFVIQSGFAGALRLGATNGTRALADTTIKVGSISTPHYTNSSLPMGVIAGIATATENSIEIGGNSSQLHSATQIRFFAGATTTSGIGSIKFEIHDTGVFVGNGRSSSTPAAGIISATGGTGTNIAGANLTISGGQSTGSGVGGDIIIATSAAGSSGTSTNTATERARISSSGLRLGGSGATISTISTDNTFAAAADTLTYTGLAIKTYVDNKIIAAGAGDVVGPASAVDSRIALFDGTTGKLIKDSGVTLAAKQDALSGASLTGVTAASDDKILIQETSDSNNLKTITVSGAVNAGISGVSLTAVTAASDDKILIQETSDSNNLKTITVSGAVNAGISGVSLTTATVATDDKVLIQDTNDSNNLKTVTTQAIADLAPNDWEYISSATASSSAEIAFTGISSTYVAIRVAFYNVRPATDITDLRVQLSDDGATYATSGYYYGAWICAAGTGNTSANNAAQITLNAALSNVAGEVSGGVFEVVNTNSSSPGHYWWSTGGIDSLTNGRSCTGSGMVSSSAADNVNAIRFYMSSGNIAAGTFVLYGIRGS